MKKILVYIVFLSVNLYAQEYWIEHPSPTSKWLTRIQFVDTLFGWASGDSGTIIHTSNGGINWVQQNSGITAYFIDDLFFLNRRLGWAISNDYLFTGTKILKTTNGGLNWQTTVFPDTTVAIFGVHFLDSLTGFLGGNFLGRIFKTTNGGATWTESFIDTAYCPIYYLFEKKNFSFLNSLTGFVCGGHIDIQGMIWKTTDGGLNWLTYCVAPEPIHRIKAINSSKIISVGGDPEYGASCVQSHDGGNSWIYDYISDNDTASYLGIGYALAFRTPSELWVPLGYPYDYNWALSLDSGSTTGYWYGIPVTDDSFYVYDATFVTPTFGWACDKKGRLLKYNTAIIGISENGGKVPDNFKLFQNYPNPFNPATTISYQLPEKSFVRITIYDLLGRELKSYTEGIRPAGVHKFRFNAANYASGVYFYKLEADNYVEAKKMVILK